MAASRGVLTALEEAAVQAFESAGRRYALIGGAALPAWGRVRATADADLLVGSAADTLDVAVSALREGGFAHMSRADRREIDDKVVLHFWFPLRDVGVSVRVDVIAGVGDETSYEDVLARAVVRQLDGLRLRVATCEDLILLKLSAGRAIDLADARELFAINQDDLDLGYLEAHARRQGLAKAVADLRSAAEEG